ncbi:G2/M phase-specific E3 ubiquitin-protein ligase-like [Hoplias malabaricus]|uniref:G2/M phase-specific E3 ubiquitin-protein ligase-like n=1 Tax=Hoplias malabaricus TaxID=27720 RepID=UPI003462126A
MQSGLGRRTAHLDESTTHEELCDALRVLYPKPGTVTGGWLICKSSGGWGSRKLSLVAPDDTGYTDWLSISDPMRALSHCANNFLRIHEDNSPLLLSMDIRSSPAEQDMALISFYKQSNVEWARPLNCRREGDAAIGQGVTRFFFSASVEKLKSGFYINFANSNITRLFEGESGHLVPSASHFLVESDMFIVAGRILGHSFLHGGPCMSGLSSAVVHVLLGGSPETATVTLEDCPDLDIRETIRILEGESKLSDLDKIRVQDLANAWDLPFLTENNRRWLYEKLLIHASKQVIGRITRQIKQLRCGLKETPMWTVLTQRPDTVPLLFAKEGAGNLSSEVLLQRITWPCEDDDKDDDYSSDTKCSMSGYLRQFITNAAPTELTNLVKFWTGWEIIPASLSVEFVNGSYPTASTCFETLRIPGMDNTSFKNDILGCISTCQTGFGLV